MLFSPFFLTAIFGRALNTKKLVREVSKKVHKFTEAEQFVFISEQSAKHPPKTCRRLKWMVPKQDG